MNQNNAFCNILIFWEEEHFVQNRPEKRWAPSITLDTRMPQSKDLPFLDIILGIQHVINHCIYSTCIHADAQNVLTLWTDERVYITHQGMASRTGHQEIYMQENPSGPSASHSHCPSAFPNRSW